MTITEYLNNLKLMRVKIKQLTEMIARIRERAYPTGISYEGDKVQTSTEDKFLKIMAKCADKAAELEMTRMKYNYECARLLNMIHELNDERYIEILKYRYIDGLRYEEIEKKIGYSARHIKRLKNEALEILEERHKATFERLAKST